MEGMFLFDELIEIEKGVQLPKKSNADKLIGVTSGDDVGNLGID